MATTKQAAENLRKVLARAERAGGVRWPGIDYEFRVPSGVHFAVRATKTGVNITIEDRGYVDRVTGGNRRKLDEHRAEMNTIKEQTDELRGKLYDPPLPGTTKWGPIIISSRVTTVTHTDRYGNQTTEDISA
jgi:hypothetical protein